MLIPSLSLLILFSYFLRFPWQMHMMTKFSHVIVRFKRVCAFDCCRMIMKCGLADLRNYLSFSQPLSSSTFSRNTVFTLSQSARFLLFIFYVVFSLNKVLTWLLLKCLLWYDYFCPSYLIWWVLWYTFPPYLLHLEHCCFLLLYAFSFLQTPLSIFYFIFLIIG